MISRYLVMNTAQCAEDTVKCGDHVYSCVKHDFGLAREDTIHFGYQFVSVTKNKDGDYPCFTIPLHDLIKVSNE